MKFLKNSKGFTLAELLIVLAVVVVLAAAAMPSVVGQVETARESVDIDTIRAAYSAAYVQAYMDANGSATGATNSDGYEMTIQMTQKEAGWRGSAPILAGVAVTGDAPESATKVTIKFGALTNGALTPTSIELS